MSLTEREQALITGFEWMRNVVHQLHHEGTHEDCPAAVCDYARKILARAKETEDGK